MIEPDKFAELTTMTDCEWQAWVNSTNYRPLKRGNHKLGDAWLSWSLPATSAGSCPGSTPACERICYGTQSFYTFDNVAESLLKNLAVASREDFVEVIVGDLVKRRKKSDKVVRIHANGDFFSAEYAGAWEQIVRIAREWEFLFYTRSWRVPGIREAIDRIADLPNARPWFSVDRETGWPESPPKFVRIAYLQLDADDRPARVPDIVFRTRILRSAVGKRVRGAVVCPVENGVGLAESVRKITCDTCRICLAVRGSQNDPRRRRRGEKEIAVGRTSLPVCDPE